MTPRSQPARKPAAATNIISPKGKSDDYGDDSRRGADNGKYGTRRAGRIGTP